AEGAAAGKRLPKDSGIQRYKGLGEMNEQELWDTTMDPDTRTLRQVTVGEAAAADEVFSVLMGEDVESRREFIQRNAHDVRFLDIWTALPRSACRRIEGRSDPAPRRPRRAGRPQARDAALVPRLRDERHRRASAAGRPRRTQAGPPPRAV